MKHTVQYGRQIDTFKAEKVPRRGDREGFVQKGDVWRLLQFQVNEEKRGPDFQNTYSSLVSQTKLWVFTSYAELSLIFPSSLPCPKHVSFWHSTLVLSGVLWKLRLMTPKFIVACENVAIWRLKRWDHDSVVRSSTDWYVTLFVRC